jgi:hypothetical protein
LLDLPLDEQRAGVPASQLVWRARSQPIERARLCPIPKPIQPRLSRRRPADAAPEKGELLGDEVTVPEGVPVKSLKLRHPGPLLLLRVAQNVPVQGQPHDLYPVADQRRPLALLESG